MASAGEMQINVTLDPAFKELASRQSGFVAVAHPGDTVILHMEDRLSDDEYEAFKAHWSELSDQTGVHVAMVEGVSGVVVVRGGSEEDAALDKEFPA